MEFLAAVASQSLLEARALAPVQFDGAGDEEDERKPAARVETNRSSPLQHRDNEGEVETEIKKRSASAVETIDLTLSDTDDVDVALQRATEASLQFTEYIDLTTTTTTAPWASSPNKKSKSLASPPSVFDHEYDPVTMNPLQQNDDDDYALALSLQNAEHVKALETTSKYEEDLEMYSSASGQAWKLVEKILAFHREHGSTRQSTTAAAGTEVAPTAAIESQQYQEPLLSVIAIDDMVYTAERFLTKLHDLHGKAVTSGATDAKTMGNHAKTPSVDWDLGYHYTTHENLSRIRTDGLLSREERTAQNIQAAKFNGSVYGEGIYVASNPYAFRNRRFGEVGLLVVRLHGGKQKVWESRRDRIRSLRRRHHVSLQPYAVGAGANGDTTNITRAVSDDEEEKEEATPVFDSTVVCQGRHDEFVVLNTAGQCLPICTFPGPNLTVGNNAAHLEAYTQALQSMLQDFWSDILGGVQVPAKAPSSEASAKGAQNITWNPQTVQHAQQDNTLPPSVAFFLGQQQQLPPQADAAVAAPGAQQAIAAPCSSPATTSGRSNLKPPPPTIITYQSPSCFSIQDADLDDVSTPLRHSTFTVISQECAICLDPLMRKDNGTIVRLRQCGHFFHRGCLLSVLGAGNTRQCPSCRSRLLAPRGTMPSGTMTISEDTSLDCSGYAGCGSIVIEYKFAGHQLQQAYHPTPYSALPSTNRTTYIPNTAQGRLLLERLKYAFSRGLIFTVGTCPTTGFSDQIILGQIPQKTDTSSGGPLGFPDASYIDACNTALDILGIPQQSDKLAPHDDSPIRYA